MRSRPSIAVILPVLDEAARIGARLAEHRRDGWADEVIVVDGGSTDDTVGLAMEGGARVLHGPRGRGPQQNAGAAAATSDVLLFQHADVALPADAAEHVVAALVRPTVVGGAFRVQTVADAGTNRLGPLLALADLRSRWTRHPYGDQAIFVRRTTFEQVGGFPEQPLMEDIELVRRLRPRGRMARVPATVQVSGRRFLAHPVRTLVMLRVFPWLYRCGVSPERLARLYGTPR